MVIETHTTTPTNAARDADALVIGGGPAGAAFAIRAARAGLKVILFDKGAPGRDKICGDGLTPRAVKALNDLNIALDDSHSILGLRMIANKTRRQLNWPGIDPYPAQGAVWKRRNFDQRLLDEAAEAGAEIHRDVEALPILEGQTAVGVHASDRTYRAPIVILATGAPGAASRLLGADRDPNEVFGLAIRTYAESPRHAEQYLEACLTMRDSSGAPNLGYGWIFPAGDGTVNIGVGALSTMKGFKKLNLNSLQATYRSMVQQEWELGPDLERPRAWRLPMATTKRHGPGWLALGDAAGLVNPMTGEGIDYALESGILAADLVLADVAKAPERYDAQIAASFDGFLRTGRRFTFLVGHPLILNLGLRATVGTEAIAAITLQVMGNLVDTSTPGAGGRTMRIADRLFAAADPLLRATRANRNE